MKHKTKILKIGKEKVDIDKKIYELVRILNEFGIKTLDSCQGEKRGYIAIDLKNVDVWHGLVNKKLLTSINLRFPTPK